MFFQYSYWPLFLPTILSAVAPVFHDAGRPFAGSDFLTTFQEPDFSNNNDCQYHDK